MYIYAPSVVKKLTKLFNRPTGENSSHLVTLFMSHTNKACVLRCSKENGYGKLGGGVK
jgi:hypothetical protein